MRRTVLYILIPCLFILGGFYFFFFRPDKDYTPANFVDDKDLMVVHIPHVYKSISEDKNKSIFQHLLHLEGIDELNKLVQKNAGFLNQEYLSNLTFVLTEDYRFVLLLDETNSSFSQNFWQKIEEVNGTKTLQTDQMTWYLKREGSFIVCSNSEKQLKKRNPEKTSWDFSNTNWKHGFVKFNKSISRKNSELAQVDFLLNLSDERVNLSGFHKSNVTSTSTLSEGIPFDMEYYLPLELNDARVKVINSGSDFFKGKTKLELPSNFSPTFLDDSRVAKFNFKTGGSTNSEVLIIKTPEVFKLAKDVFGIKSGKISSPKSMSFLKNAFPETVGATKELYAFQTGEIIVFGGRESIKGYQKTIERNAVWAYSLERMRWLEEELIPSNEYHISQSMFLLNSLNSDTAFSNYLERNTSVLDALPYVVVQKSYEGNGLFTGVSIVLDDEVSNDYNSTEGIAVDESLLKEQEIAQFPAILNSKPFPVKSHVDKQLRFVLTDLENNIYLVNQAGVEEWSYKLDGRLLSSVLEVDLFKNRKIQYVFATDKKVYAVDRLGRMVENFPIVLPENASISGFTLIDYDKSKNYRFAINSGRNVWLFNSSGESLEKWNPMKMESEVSSRLQHVRIDTKDYLVVQESSGKVSLFHRNGDLYENSPISVGKNLIKNGLNITATKLPDESYLTFLTTEGKLKKYDFEAKKINEEGLSQSSGFDSLFVQNKRSDFRYFALRGKTLEVYDEKYVKKYENSDLSKVFNVQAYNLSGIDLYAIYHTEGMTLISEEGKIIMDNISTLEPITLYYSRANRQGYFYYVSENKLLKSSFNL